MNENSNGIISRKIISKLFNIFGFVYKFFLPKYLNYNIDDKIIKKLYNISCSLDNTAGCNNYGVSFYN